MKNTPLMYGLIGLLAGSLLTVFVMSNITKSSGEVSDKNTHTQEMTENKKNNMMGEHGQSMTMDEMSAALENLKGDEFDKAFIEMMIDHHQGAIDMAKLAEINANHGEIKQLSRDIVNAQNGEIDQMRQWYNEWYK